MKMGAPKRQAEALNTPEGNWVDPESKHQLSGLIEALAKKDLSNLYRCPLVP